MVSAQYRISSPDYKAATFPTSLRLSIGLVKRPVNISHRDWEYWALWSERTNEWVIAYSRFELLSFSPAT